MVNKGNGRYICTHITPQNRGLNADVYVCDICEIPLYHLAI